jgi:hypothetical protein
VVISSKTWTYGWIFFSLWLYSPLDLRCFSSLLILYTVGMTPWMGDQSVARPPTTHRRNTHKYLCLEWDLKPRSQCLSGRRRFMPQTAWPATVIDTDGNTEVSIIVLSLCKVCGRPWKAVQDKRIQRVAGQAGTNISSMKQQNCIRARHYFWGPLCSSDEACESCNRKRLPFPFHLPSRLRWASGMSVCVAERTLFLSALCCNV